MAIRHLVRGENYRKSFQVLRRGHPVVLISPQETGDPESSVWSCGQVMGLIDDIPTCQVLIERMVAEAEAVIVQRLAPMVSRSRL